MSSTAFMVNGFDVANAHKVEPHMQELIARRAKALGPSYKLFYEHPVHFVRAEGVYLYDADGTPYLDVYNNVPSVGHCHPRVIEAVNKQMTTLNSHTRYLNERILDYADDLLSTFPAEMSNVMFTCTGSESVDLAMRIARFHTKGTGFIVTRNAYHGITASVAEISPTMGPYVPVGQHVQMVEAPDAYRTEPGVDVGEAFAKDVERAINDLERHGIRFAGMIVDTVFSTDGLLPHPAGFLKKAVDVVHQRGGLFIADEVQPGFARLGDSMWGFQRHGILPDMAVMGKPMGNGLPIAAVVAKPELLAEFGNKVRYFNTFGGNSVCIAAAQAVLDVIRDEKLMENSKRMGEYILNGLREATESHPGVGDVRGAGLYLAVEFVKDKKTKERDGEFALRLVNALRENRVLISATGLGGNSLKIRPPLPFTKANSDEFIDIFKKTLEQIS
jgi:4-aminobutyrate aminotransferase-like enzyme